MYKQACGIIANAITVSSVNTIDGTVCGVVNPFCCCCCVVLVGSYEKSSNGITTTVYLLAMDIAYHRENNNYDIHNSTWSVHEPAV